MKTFLTCLLLSSVLFSCGQSVKNKPDTAKTGISNIHWRDPAKKVQIVEASCGECQFHMEGKGCDLAVRINGKSYFVEGTSIDEHGDAHADDGFCEAIRKAEVQGEVVNGRFKATYFKLLTDDPKKTN